MALIVLATICLLACVFLLFVLCQWMRDAKRKTTTRPVIDNEVGETRNTKHLQIVRARRAVGRCESGYDELERIAYERIARSYTPY
jgi:hypothetical protein